MSQLQRRREGELQTCQRRLEYLGSRLQDLAVELGDGQGAVWLKENMWFLNKPALYFDDALFSVGKICNHLVTYLSFHKTKLESHFPFLSYMGILYEVGEILGIVRDMLLVDHRQSLSVKQSQLDMFWTDCTPFLFIFENNNHLLLNSQQICLYMQSLMDLVPTVIQVGLCMYCSNDAQLRGFDCFAETCLRLSRALVETGDFLSVAEQLEPTIVPFLRQWIMYALDLVQRGVKVRTDNAGMVPPLSPKVTNYFTDQTPRSELNNTADEQDNTIPKSLSMLSLSTDSTIPDDVAEFSLAPLKIHNASCVRASCQPFKWIAIAKTRLVQCPNEVRKMCLEEMCLKENQRLVSDIFLVSGEHPESWKGVKIHCPLTKMYNELKMKVFVKVKRGDRWEAIEAIYEKQLFHKGHFLTFDGCAMEGFVSVEQRPMVTKELGVSGGTLTTEYDINMEATIPAGSLSKASLVRMMVQPPDKPRERQYRDTCPDVFRHIQSTSSAIEIDGAHVGPDGKINLKIPFEVLRDSNTKILILKYTNDGIEINDGDDLMRRADNCYTVTSSNGGTVLASVDRHRHYSTGSESVIRNEMELILGKKQLCKLLILVEHQQVESEADVSMDQVVFCIVCAEKYRVSEVLKEKTKVGLIELPKSQSPDRLLKQTDDITLDIKGSIKLDPDIPQDAYTLTYLEGSDNYFRFPATLTDHNGRITFILRLGKDNSSLHTFFFNVQDLLSLIVQGIVPCQSPTPGNDDVFHDPAGTYKEEKETEVIKVIPEAPVIPNHPEYNRSPSVVSDSNNDEPAGETRDLLREANLKILNRNSLVNLAKHLGKEEGHLLGVRLGMKPEKVGQIIRMYRHSSSLASFYVLYEWRGRRTLPELADKLIHALTNIDRRDLANVVKHVRDKNRGLTAEDFHGMDSRPRTTRSRRS